MTLVEKGQVEEARDTRGRQWHQASVSDSLRALSLERSGGWARAGKFSNERLDGRGVMMRAAS